MMWRSAGRSQLDAEALLTGLQRPCPTPVEQVQVQVQACHVCYKPPSPEASPTCLRYTYSGTVLWTLSFTHQCTLPPFRCCCCCSCTVMHFLSPCTAACPAGQGQHWASWSAHDVHDTLLLLTQPLFRLQSDLCPMQLHTALVVSVEETGALHQHLDSLPDRRRGNVVTRTPPVPLRAVYPRILPRLLLLLLLLRRLVLLLQLLLFLRVTRAVTKHRTGRMHMHLGCGLVRRE